MYLFLLTAICCEMAATFSLRHAVAGRMKALFVAVPGYCMSILFLNLSYFHGMDLGVAYGMWVSIGMAGTGLLSWSVFKEKFNAVKLFGLALTMVGVVMLLVGSSLR